jgi:hypothetical protein
MLHQNECRNIEEEKTVVLVSRVTNPSRQRKLQQLHWLSISRNTESQQSREPDKLREKGSLL